MKYALLPLALTLTLACLQPITLRAEDDDQKNKDKKEDKGHQTHSDKGATKVVSGKQGAPVVQSHGKQVHGSDKSVTSQRNTVQAVHSQSVTQQSARGGNYQNYSRQSQSQPQFNPPQGNRSNHYGGRWVEGNEHSDWGNSGEHYWHHHHYRWYDGGWLIVDFGNGPGYPTGGSIGSAVQQSLSEQGYYHGPIDGDIGPGSSRAIANYQDDHGLRVTGEIDDPLVQSLGLQ